MAARARSRFDQDDDVGPKSDVYTGLLALSLIAMIVSSLLLFLDYSQYGNMKAPAVSVPQPKGREGVQTGQLPPPLLQLPPPAPVGERPFTRGNDAIAAQPVKPVGGEEAQAPVVVPAPVPEPPPAPAPTPVAEAPPAPAPVNAPPPAPEPVAAPPTPAANTPPAPPPQPVPPPLPKSIRSLPN